MKQLVKNYSINSSAKTITLTDFTANGIVPGRLLLITDVTTQSTIYQWNLTTGVSFFGTSITYSTFPSGVANTDALQIYYDTQTGDPTYDTGPLPSNAAKESGGNLASIATNTSGLATATSQAAGNATLTTIATNTGSGATAANQTNGSQKTQVTNFPSTQPVSGSISVANLPTTQPVSATALPLPSNAAQETGGNIATIAANTAGLATSAAQTAGNSSLSTIVTNTGTSATAANQTNGSQVTKVSDGTSTASVLAGDSGQNAILIAGARKETTFSTTTAASTPWLDVSDFAAISVQISSQGTGSTVSFQMSNDQTSVFALPMASVLVQADYVSSTGAIGIFSGAKNFKFVRLNITGISAGTTSGIIELFTVAQPGLFTAVLNKANSNVGVSLAGQTAAVNIGGASSGVMADGASNPTTQPIAAYGMVYDGTIWNRLRNTTVSSSSAITSVTAATSSTTILASNANRKSMFLFNDSSSVLYLAFAATASTTAYSIQVPASSLFEMPTPPVYTGAISGIWATAAGSARITELT